MATGVDGNLVDTVGFKQVTDLPGVYVKTGLGTAIPGATVTFSMLNPVTAPVQRHAVHCVRVRWRRRQSGPTIVVTTDANGFAALGCVNFGPTVGFKNLQASIDPSTADGVAGGGITEVTVTACDPVCGVAGATTTLHWLVETKAGNADRLSIQSIATTAVAGSVFGQQPVLRVLDRLNNVVLSPAVVVTPAATGPAGSTGGLIGSSTPSSVSGVVNFSGLGIGGTAGVWKVKFTAPGSIKADSANVTITAGAAATIQTLMRPGSTVAQTYTYAGIVTSGTPVNPVPKAVVKDQYGNPVNLQTVTWSAVNSTVTVGSGGTTDANGLAAVTSWTPGIGESTLLASVGALNPASFSATSALGASVFLCELGVADLNFLTYDNSKNKTDLGPLKVADPKKNILDLFFYMSVTGQSNTFASYPVDVKVYRTASNATSQAGSIIGLGHRCRGLARQQRQAAACNIQAEPAGRWPRSTNNQSLWFVVTIVNPPGGRTFQIWHSTLVREQVVDGLQGVVVKSGTTLKVGAEYMLKN